MGRKKADTGVKIGHSLTPAASALMQMLSVQSGADEAAVLEMGIRLVYNLFPSGQRDAMSVLLRGKGLSIRDLRRIDTLAENTVDGAGEVQGSSPELVRISQIHRKSTAPVDQAIAVLTDQN